MDNPDSQKIIFINHPFIILRGFFAPLLIISIGILQNIDTIIEGYREIRYLYTAKSLYFILPIAGILLLCVLIGLYQFFIWKNTFISIDNKEILWQKRGLFLKRKKQSSLANISNINQKASFLQRIFGVNEVTLDLNSIETAGVKDFKIFLSNDIAIEFKEVLNERIKLNKGISSDGEHELSDVSEVDVSENILFERSYTGKESIRHLILNEGLIAILVIAVLGAVLSFVAEGSRTVGILSIAIVTVGILATLFQSLNISMNFQVKRIGENLHISNGFTSKNNFTIPVRNITGISTTQGIFSRIFGYEMVKVEAIGVVRSKQTTNYVSLLMKKAEIEEYVSSLLPEFKLSREFIGMHKKILIYLFVRNSMIFSILGVVVLISIAELRIGLFLIPLIIIAATVATTVFGYFYNKIDVKSDRITLRQGIAGLSSHAVQIKKIELISTSSNFILRKMGFIKLKIGSRGGVGRREYTTGWFPKEMFDEIISYYRAGEKRLKSEI